MSPAVRQLGSGWAGRGAGPWGEGLGATGQPLWGARPRPPETTVTTGVVPVASAGQRCSWAPCSVPLPVCRGAVSSASPFPFPRGTRAQSWGGWALTPGGTVLQGSSPDWESQRPPGAEGRAHDAAPRTQGGCRLPRRAPCSHLWNDGGGWRLVVCGRPGPGAGVVLLQNSSPSARLPWPGPPGLAVSGETEGSGTCCRRSLLPPPAKPRGETAARGWAART